MTRDLIRRLPKAELHVHLDGSIRPQTMIELARDQGVRLPAGNPEGLARAVHARHAQSLEEYLERYQITLSVMQKPAALERIAYEFLVDAAAENISYVEVRYCPALHTGGMTLVQAVESVLAGLRRGERETGSVARVIVCALRTLSPEVSLDLARLAVDYSREGVVGFDLAGAEQGHPAADHVRAFEYARSHGLRCTCHAGEGDGAESVRQALGICGAERIGHGTRLYEDPQLEAYVRDRRIPLEVCLTSNLHTGTVRSLEAHPVRRYLEAGLVVTLNTDSRLVDGTTLSDELWLAHNRLGLTQDQIERVILNGFESAFLPEEEKRSLLARVRAEWETLR